MGNTNAKRVKSRKVLKENEKACLQLVRVEYEVFNPYRGEWNKISQKDYDIVDTRTHTLIRSCKTLAVARNLYMAGIACT